MKKCWKNFRDNFSKWLKSRERKTISGAETSTIPKCKLFTQMLFLKDSILNRTTTSNVISNSQSVSVEVSSLPRSNPSSSSTSSTRNGSVKRKRSKLSKPSLDTADQALLKYYAKKIEMMEIPDADVSFANSIVPILQSLPAKKKPTCKNGNTAGLNEI